METSSRRLRNITITLDRETAARARVQAAERKMSLSRYIGEVLRQHTGKPDEYERAMRRFLSKGPFKQLKGAPQKYPTRDELHDRPALRRR